MGVQMTGVFSDIDGASLCFLVGVILFALRHHLTFSTAAFWNGWVLRLTVAAFCSFLTNVLLADRRPLPLLLVTFLLVIFLVESMRLWALTNIFTKIDLSVFPKFRRCSENFTWPQGKLFDDTKKVLAANGFDDNVLLKIGDGDGFGVYCQIFYNKNRRVRLQITLNILSGRQPFPNCSLSSTTKDGRTIVTGNMRNVSSSFYPESWLVQYHPMASLKNLLEVHEHRIRTVKTVKFDDSNSLETINGEQHQLELENCQLGYCEKLDGNSHITLSFAGRYRLWHDMLRYSYFGKYL
jgi:hypothetical protein